MEIPKRLVIDGLEWEVTLADLSEDRHGDTDGDECQIRLRRAALLQINGQTFWHELVHAIARTRDIDPDKKWKEEKWATFLGPALHAFFEANATIEWRQHGEEKET